MNMASISLKRPGKASVYCNLKNGERRKLWDCNCKNFSFLLFQVSQADRDNFGAYDEEKSIRKTFVEALNKEFPPDEFGLHFAIGGQISIDAFPHNWDKRYCLKFVEKQFQTIHFFGDRTSEGGNDYHIYADERTIGHSVQNPEDTMQQLTKLFNL